MSGLFGSYSSVVELFFLHALLAYSQQIVLKAGVFSFGTVGFAALGAYTTGWLAVHTGAGAVASIAGGIAAAAAAAAAVGLVCRELRGIYLAIATLAFVLGLQSLALVVPSVTGGALGLIGIPGWASFDVLLVVVVVASLLLALVEHSRLGGEFDAVRSDEEAAASVGVRTDSRRVLALVLSAGLAGLGGALYASYASAIFPGDFGFPLMITVLAYVILGGLTRWWGALLGTAALITLFELLRSFGDYRPVVSGVVLVVVVFLFPRGLVGLIESLPRAWRLALAVGREAAAPGEASRA